MTKAIIPKITPSTPRSAISHQLRASASPRLSVRHGHENFDETGHFQTLCSYSTPSNVRSCRGKAASGAGVTLALTRATDGTKAEFLPTTKRRPTRFQLYAQNLDTR